ncbi:hypothetical protein [Serinibacter salmoneus]|uniref:Peptide subunit release factor 1 (ERF1) n=1 Tax=Serinibacter salmoneus TaxID=556530 RepID=A0A2A9D2I8_9MICO|nr:hypothetical protein [Serinibacter salmoneus]PFG20917.1 hypothetical protein ATL40_2533 [Serinibacter salmoneus]
MLPVDLPSITDITTLSTARSDASVSIYLRSSPQPAQHEAVRIELRNAIDEARRHLEAADLDHERIETTLAPLHAVPEDTDFWDHQSTSMALFAADGELHAFRLANRVQARVRVSDRFDVGALLRARTFPHGGYVLGLAEDHQRLWQVHPDAPAQEIPLDLPHDLHLALEHAHNHGQADAPRGRGNLGDQPGRERLAARVQEEVLRHLDGEHPLILAATPDLDPAYRAINTYPRLLEGRIEAHPTALDSEAAEAHARDLLDAAYAAQIDAWREHFGTRRSNGFATSSLREVAVAATLGQVEDLHFDMDEETQGTIDEFGAIQRADSPGPRTYGVVDEIAARVLAAHGSVYAVRNADLLDGSPVAALLRVPKDTLGL